MGVLLLAAGLLTGASLGSLQFGSGDLMGPFGNTVALALYAVLGMSSYLVALAFALMALRYLMPAHRRSDWLMWIGYSGATALSAVFLHCLYPAPRLQGFGSGGKTGEILGEFLLAIFSEAGTYLVAGVGLLLCLMAATDISLVEAVVAVSRFCKRFGLWAAHHLKVTAEILKRTFSWKAEVSLAVSTAEGGELALAGSHPEKRNARASTEPPSSTEAAAAPTRRPVKDAQADDAAATDAPTAAKIDADLQNGGKTSRPTDGRRKRGPAPRLPKIVQKSPKKKEKVKLVTSKPDSENGDYVLPSLDLLAPPTNTNRETDRQTMLDLAQRLEATLEDYGIHGRIREIHPGPVVTMYEFAPRRGTKLSKITALSSDLAMSMEATKVRIVAPIPGKPAVGIEIPNRSRETVFLKELLEDGSYYKGKPRLRLALGKDLSGEITTLDLTKAPHLLIAGATGAGKSVGVHAMVLSLLYQYTPQQLRLLLIDPKMLEFSCYADIPHLLHPVVTDPTKANLALRWAVEEMENRYQKLAELGVRDLESYNRKVERLRKAAAGEKDDGADSDDGQAQQEDPDEVEMEIVDGDADPSAGTPAAEAPPVAITDRNRDALDPSKLEKLPYVVIVIDEFADLMMAAPKEVETSVARIAQKARAAGIHMAIATQRPSTDVITGLIRANFPTRIAYQVSSKVDSRVVLEQHGAEALLGMGDMLFSNRGLAPKRAHGPYVSGEEIDAVIEHIKQQGRPNYNMDIVKPSADSGPGDDEPIDPKYDEAVAIVAAQKNASISFLQRKLRVGYNRAARMIEHMEEQGVVGPSDGVKGREVLVSSFE
jgi:S-DNA-T family DNA segregation ATPase FtsK/SpoIIIE